MFYPKNPLSVSVSTKKENNRLKNNTMESAKTLCGDGAPSLDRILHIAPVQLSLIEYAESDPVQAVRYRLVNKEFRHMVGEVPWRLSKRVALCTKLHFVSRIFPRAAAIELDVSPGALQIILDVRKFAYLKELTFKNWWSVIKRADWFVDTASWRLTTLRVDLISAAACRDIAMGCKHIEAFGAGALDGDSLFALHRNGFLERLQTLELRDTSNDVVLQVAKFCPNLTTLVAVSWTDDLDEGFIAVVKACPRLTAITADHVSDAVLYKLATHLPSITFLNLSNNSRVFETGLSDVLKKCPHLHRLILHNCLNVKGSFLVELLNRGFPVDDIFFDTDHRMEAYHFIKNRHLARIAAERPTVFSTRIHLDEFPLVTDDGISAVTRSNPGVTEIFLKELSITDEALASIASTQKDLNYLCVMDCDVTVVGFLRVARDCPRLRGVLLRDTDDDQTAAAALRLMFPTLQVAVLRHSDIVGEGSLSQMFPF
jgi:hypothetical protein